LAQMTAARLTSLYDLADAAYDAKEIREMSARLGHVALIDHNPRRGEKREFSPAEAVRYRERSGAPPNESTPTCMTNTAAAMSGCAGQSRCPPTWPSACW